MLSVRSGPGTLGVMFTQSRKLKRNRHSVPCSCIVLLPVVIAMPSFSQQSSDGSERVRSGLEVLLDERMSLIEGKAVGIVTNHTACDAEGRHIADLLGERAEVVALYGPEHGIRGDNPAGAFFDGETDGNGPAVYSIYGEFLGPTSAMLKGVEVMLFDIQDIGARFYTYISTLYLVMEACAREGIPVIVLDRPNPIGGMAVEGPVTSPVFGSFVGVAPITIRHGMTVGELAVMFNQEGYLGHHIGGELTVVPCKGWRRSMWYDDTGLPWISPSPNMPSLDAAAVYPGVCLIEGTNLSEGRGTPTPFLLTGAPWIDAEEWAKTLNDQDLPGVEFEAVTFTPISIPEKSPRPKHQDKECGGVRIRITDRDSLQPVALGVALLTTVRDLYPEKLTLRRSHLDRLWGSQRLRESVEAGLDWRAIIREAKVDSERFEKIRKRYLMYGSGE